MINIHFSKLTTIFIAIVLISIFFHISFRQKHFQELDSFGVYHVLNDFPNSAMQFINMSYKGSGFSVFDNEENARSFLERENIEKNISAILGDKYNKKNKEIIISNLVDGSSPFIYLRVAEVFALKKIEEFLPTPFFTAMVLPLSSTYSPGPGFFYGFMNINGSYDGFMNFAVSWHILIFHIGVLLLFFIVFSLSKNIWTAATTAFMMLFSFSLYSYSYHIGSTIWHIFVPIVFIALSLYYYKKDNERQNLLKKISYFSSILLFFSYLTAYFWLAFILAMVLIDKDNKESLDRKYFRKLIKSQIIFIISLTACILLIFPAGQGYRGSADGLFDFIRFFYYSILNFFYIFVDWSKAQIIEFLFFIILLFSGFFYFYKKEKKREEKFIFYFISVLLIFYLVSVIFGVLSFIPSRHVLFLAPILFIIISYAIDKFYSSSNIYFLAIFNILLIILGFYSLVASSKVTFDMTLNAKVSNNVRSVVVYGENYPLLYRFQNYPGAFIKKSNVPLAEQIEPNQLYMYMSQTSCFEDIVVDAKSENIDIIFNNKKKYITGQKFVAFDPADFAWNSANNFCQAEFIWKK